MDEKGSSGPAAGELLGVVESGEPFLSSPFFPFFPFLSSPFLPLLPFFAILGETLGNVRPVVVFFISISALTFLENFQLKLYTYKQGLQVLICIVKIVGKQ